MSLPTSTFNRTTVTKIVEINEAASKTLSQVRPKSIWSTRGLISFTFQFSKGKSPNSLYFGNICLDLVIRSGSGN